MVDVIVARANGEFRDPALIDGVSARFGQRQCVVGAGRQVSDVRRVRVKRRSDVVIIRCDKCCVGDG